MTRPDARVRRPAAHLKKGQASPDGPVESAHPAAEIRHPGDIFWQRLIASVQYGDNSSVTHEPAGPLYGVANTVAGAVVGNVVQARSIGEVHLHGPARPVAKLPHRAGSPPLRAFAFQGRTVNGFVSNTVVRGQTPVPASDCGSTSIVLSGLGGVGKTQLALDHAEALWAAGELDLLVWVTATSRDSIISGYSRLAVDLTGVDDRDAEHGAQRLLEWLANTSARWLVVLDDLQHPSDLRGLWPPSSPTGRTMVTTRRRDAALRGHRRRLIEVGVFTPDEAYAYLNTALADWPSLLDDVAGVAADLGYLPLALAQAGAYMLDRGLSCTAYRARYTDRRHRLAFLLPDEQSLPDEHRMALAATWSLSIEQANQLQPAGLARPLLEMISLLDCNGIPATVLRASAALEWLSAVVGRQISAEDTRDGLGCLQRLNLITLNPHAGMTDVQAHALVQRATRDSLPDDQLRSAVCAAAMALWEVWPVDLGAEPRLEQVLRANTDVLNEIGGAYLWESGAHILLGRAGFSLGDNGLVAEARDYFQRLHANADRYLGRDHPTTLGIHGNIARWRGQSGDPVGATADLEDLLTDVLRVLGPDDRSTMLLRHSLAHCRGKAGDPAGAVIAFEELLADELRIWNTDRPDILETRQSIADWRGEAGDPAGAVATLEELLADQLRVLGDNHVQTLRSRRRLAHWYGKAKDPAGAVSALEKLLADMLRFWGPDHLDTLATRRSLAHWRGEAGDLAGAVAALEELLAKLSSLFGPDHPNTRAVVDSLARWTEQRPDDATA